MKTLSKNLLALTAILIAYTSLNAAKANPYVDLEAFGYLIQTSSTKLNNGRPNKTLPVASNINKTVNDEITELTLTQTFANSSSQAMVVEYVMPMPNPAALLDYQLENTVTVDCTDDEYTADQEFLLASGETVTIKVTYKLLNKQLVSFHPTSADYFAIENAEHLLATK